MTAICHYRVSGLEGSFKADITKQISYLKANPFLFQVFYRNVRRVQFNEFLYSIHFTISDQQVWILRILHHKQNFE
ncbi:type II toxin-antitoxin system RelE/ParE family toxin [Cytophaga sp. FL35]|uniref:type II toxin-antitoxin system RelE/ParE family toxin n=1 Tax=Cytophaga sp. FL35 TaxID=1904456 RepID=UPI0016535469|nr:type II toxin-antitoxin system RelE/ParE family toxin [Cytophaga sp. FL35]